MSGTDWRPIPYTAESVSELPLTVPSAVTTYRTSGVHAHICFALESTIASASASCVLASTQNKYFLAGLSQVIKRVGRCSNDSLLFAVLALDTGLSMLAAVLQAKLPELSMRGESAGTDKDFSR